MTALAVMALVLALLPLVLTLDNLRLYRPPAERAPPGTRLSVLIPARNEEANIARAVEAVLGSRGIDFEVVVLDDGSTDRTGEIVAAIARRDPRVRLETPPPLPPGWSGKQHACHVLAGKARHDLMLFVDADVRLAPDALARAAGFLLARPGTGLVSGFPRQETGTLAEALLVPMIHVLLLGYLPIRWMRRGRAPSLGAGCGQFILVRRPAYEAAGGHAAIRASLHDGLTLPRALRRAGWKTDLFDAAGLASCRMYHGAAETWAGFLKNATEGMATPVALPVWTLLLFGGHVLPWLLLPWAPGLALPAVAAGLAQRLLLARRLRQRRRELLLHPLGVLAMLALQWHALLRSGRGRPAQWRGRTYPQA